MNCEKCNGSGQIADPVNRTAGGTNTPDNIRPICRECNALLNVAT